MTSPDEQLESLSQRIQERERAARRRGMWLTLIPILVAGAFLSYTVWQIAQAEQRLQQETTLLAQAAQTQAALNTSIPAARAEVNAAETEQAKLRDELSQAQEALSQSRNSLATATAQFSELQMELDAARVFAPNTCPLDEMVLKEYSSDFTLQAQVLDFLLRAQYRSQIPWNPGGFSETEGFNSPNFALYVLQNAIPGLPLVSPDYPPGSLPWNILKPIPESFDGDLVFYPSGYTMFYYELPIRYGLGERMKCVIGMTPLGILSLEVGFAEGGRALDVVYP